LGIKPRPDYNQTISCDTSEDAIYSRLKYSTEFKDVQDLLVDSWYILGIMSLLWFGFAIYAFRKLSRNHNNNGIQQPLLGNQPFVWRPSTFLPFFVLVISVWLPVIFMLVTISSFQHYIHNQYGYDSPPKFAVDSSEKTYAFITAILILETFYSSLELSRQAIEVIFG